MIPSILADKIFQRGTGVSLQEIENLYTLQVWEVVLRLLERSPDTLPMELIEQADGTLKESLPYTYPMELIEQAEVIVSKFNEWDSERDPAL